MTFKYFIEGDITFKVLWRLIREYRFKLLILPTLFGILTLAIYHFTQPVWEATAHLDIGRKNPIQITYDRYPFILREEHLILTINSMDFLLKTVLDPNKRIFDENIYNDTLKSKQEKNEELRNQYQIIVRARAFSQESAKLLLSESFHELKNIEAEIIKKFQFIPPPATTTKIVGEVSLREVSIPPRKGLVLVMAILIGLFANIILADFHFHRKSQ